MKDRPGRLFLAQPGNSLRRSETAAVEGEADGRRTWPQTVELVTDARIGSGRLLLAVGAINSKDRKIYMRRRDFIAGLGGAAVWPLAVVCATITITPRRSIGRRVLRKFGNNGRTGIRYQRNSQRGRAELSHG
jgi:hypothetical protein